MISFHILGLIGSKPFHSVEQNNNKIENKYKEQAASLQFAT
jgi:hypothetical protein